MVSIFNGNIVWARMSKIIWQWKACASGYCNFQRTNIAKKKMNTSCYFCCEIILELCCVVTHFFEENKKVAIFIYLSMKTISCFIQTLSICVHSYSNMVSSESSQFHIIRYDPFKSYMTMVMTISFTFWWQNPV